MDAVLTCMVTEKVGPGEMNIKLGQLVRESFFVDGDGVFRSASIALSYALSALDVPPGSGIIISALAPAWHYQAIKKLGFVPVLADVDTGTALVTRESVDDAVRRGGRVILLHETLGYLPDMEALLSLNLPLIEDISQSAGATLAGKMAGQFGIFSILGLEENDLLTSGGGAVLMAPARRESIVLKKLLDEAPLTDILPDINSALAWVQLKELSRNAVLRKDLNDLYVRSLLQGRHKTVLQQGEGNSANYSFPVILSSGFKDVKQYVNRKEIEIELAFSGSVAGLLGESIEGCPNAASLLMRCVLFPLYPRLGTGNATKIAKILATLP
jgi:Predicted pyridoxal phosphate-dependent enzyme apparently involved in regulation of cell wall biogenesis